MTCTRLHNFIASENYTWFILYKKALHSFTYDGISIEDDDYLENPETKADDQTSEYIWWHDEPTPEDVVDFYEVF